MSRIKTIAIDAMGGDGAPDMVVHGVARALGDLSARFILFGQEKLIKPSVDKYIKHAAKVEIVDVDNYISAEDKPSTVIRAGKKSSIGQAIQAVKAQQADAVISAGNTGAYAALAKLILGTLPKIKRPAIATQLPTKNGSCVALDLGANAECSSEKLVQFAILGEALAQAIGKKNPKIALLNIGSENNKGNQIVQETADILRNKQLVKNYIGFIEGDGIWRGEADIVVTDGFSGNIALKSAEGAASLLIDHIKCAFQSGGLLTKFAVLLMKNQLKNALGCFDPRKFNGAVFLGLCGVAVKSHGGTDSVGFSNAIRFTTQVLQEDLLTKIMEHTEFSVSSLEN